MLAVGTSNWDGTYADQGSVYTYGCQPNATVKDFYNNGNGIVQSSTSTLMATIDGAARLVITATNVVASGQIRFTSGFASTGMQSPYYTVASLSEIKTDIKTLDDEPLIKFEKQLQPVLRKYKLKNPCPSPKEDEFKEITVDTTEKLNDIDPSKEGEQDKTELIITAKEQYDRAYFEWKRIDDDPLYSRERVGFIVEELPEEFVSDDGRGWDIQSFIAHLYSKATELEARIKKLEAVK
jgi:hypothetical protein